MAIRPDLDQALFDFDKAWRSGPAPQVEAFLAAIQTPLTGSARREFVEELVKIDLEYRWRQGGRNSAGGKPPRLEEYAARLPDLGGVNQLALDLIGEEYRLRHARGDRPAQAEYLARFPCHGPALRDLLAQIDCELAAEKAPNPAEQFAARPDIKLASSVAVEPVGTLQLMEALRTHQLLRPAEMTEASLLLARGQYPYAQSFAKKLLQRGYLTPFQINQLLRGRGAELTIGPYLLLERLGEGGAGQVFKARHRRMKRVVALKLIRKDLQKDPEILSRFSREIQVISRLNHPNVVRALDAGEENSLHYLIMEFVDGIDLSRLVKQSGPLSAEQACDYIRQAALGLSHIHAHGLVHRDIKPSNLLLHRGQDGDAAAAGPWGLVRIVDLGLARLCQPLANSGEVERTMGTLTPAGASMMGTPDYLAPEQAVDFHGADIRADIYSLGCTLYFLVAGHPPFGSATTLAEKLLRHQQAARPSLTRVRSGLPPALDAVLVRMLAKSPGDRYQAPAEVAAALAPLCGASAAPTAKIVADDGTPAAMAVRIPSAPRRWLTAAFTSVRRHGLKLLEIGRPLGQAGLARWQALGRRSKIGVGIGFLLIFTLLIGGWSILSAGSPLDRLELPADQRTPSVPKELVWVIPRPPDAAPGPMQVAFSADGRLVACYQEEKLISLWDVRRRRGLSVPGTKPTALALSPDSQTLVHGEGEGLVVWDLRAGEPNKVNTKGLNAIFRHLVFSPDGKLLWAATRRSSPGDLMLFALEGHDLQLLARKRYGHEIACLAIAPDAKLLAVGSGDIQLWDPKYDTDTSLVALPRLRPAPDELHLRSVDFSANGEFLLSGFGDEIVTWNVAKRSMQNSLKHKGISQARYSKNGRSILAWNTETSIMTAYDVASQKKLNEWQLQPGKPAAWAPDGRHVATSDEAGKVYIFRLPGY